MSFILLKSKNLNYCIESSFVEEVIRMVMLTELPHRDEKYDALLNYRGDTIPVLDISKYFHQECSSYGIKNVIIIINYFDIVIGLITDNVIEIISPENVSNLSDNGIGYFSKSILYEDNIYPVLSLEKLIKESEINEKMIFDDK